MNERAVKVLVDAAMQGLPQEFDDPMGKNGDALCAVRRLARALPVGVGMHEYYALTNQACPMCADGPVREEQGLILHLNDYHRADYLTIARKLGPDA